MYRHSSKSSKRVRFNLFWWIIAIVFLGSLVIYKLDTEYIDLAIFMYVCVTVLGLCSLWLFIDWWWCMNRSATRIYACFTSLIAVIVFRALLDIHAATFRLDGDLVGLNDFHQSFIWQIRSAPEVVVFAYLFSFAYARMMVGSENGLSVRDD